MVKKDLVTYVILSILFIVGLLGLRFYVFEPYEVTKQDANTYLHQGELVLAFQTVKPDYRDFVLYEVKGKKRIGRIIAKPRDTVTYMDDVLYLNERVQEEPYLETLKKAYYNQFVNGSYFTHDFSVESLTNTVDKAIPEDDYLILNDHRNNTEDSRRLGLVNRSEIIGVVSFRLSPLSQFGFIDIE